MTTILFITFLIHTERDNTNQISCVANSLLSPPHTYVCWPNNIFLTYVNCATDITPSTQPTPPIYPRPAQPVFAQLSLSPLLAVWVLGRRFKLLSVEHLFHLLDLCRFFCSLFLLANIIWARATQPSLFQGNKNKYFICLTWHCLLRFLGLPRFVAL